MRTSLIRAAALVALLSLASPAFAAYNDVALGSSAVIMLGSIELDVTGSASAIASITVNSTNFTATVAAGSSLAISAPSLNQISVAVNDTSVNVTTVCTASASTVSISSNVGDTISVNADTATCPRTDSTSSGGSGGNGAPAGGGGGGGGGSVVIPATAAVTAPITPTYSNPAASTALFAALTKVLSKGSKGASVMVLQQMLNQDPDTQVALSGAGSPGHETTLFGAATLTAIKKFQLKWGIAKSGDSGYGNLGPKTRAKLNALNGN